MAGKIPFVDLFPQYEELKAETDAAIAEIIRKSAFIQGPAVKEFEQALAESVGLKHAVGVANATSALMAAFFRMNAARGAEEDEAGPDAGASLAIRLSRSRDDRECRSA